MEREFSKATATNSALGLSAPRAEETRIVCSDCNARLNDPEFKGADAQRAASYRRTRHANPR
jgi:hypothetical protein